MDIFKSATNFERTAVFSLHRGEGKGKFCGNAAWAEANHKKRCATQRTVANGAFSANYTVAPEGDVTEAREQYNPLAAAAIVRASNCVSSARRIISAQSGARGVLLLYE
jgi:hypothetical protein